MSLFTFDEVEDHTPKIERMLIEAGINVNLKDDDGRTPIFYLFYKHAFIIDDYKRDPAATTMALLKTQKIDLKVTD